MGFVLERLLVLVADCNFRRQMLQREGRPRRGDVEVHKEMDKEGAREQVDDDADEEAAYAAA